MYGVVSSAWIPSSFRKVCNLSAVYSPPLSDLIFLGALPNLVCTCLTYSFIFSGTSDFCPNKYTSVYLLESSIMVMKYLFPPGVVVCIGPQTSVSIKSRISSFFHSDFFAKGFLVILDCMQH